MEKLEREQDPTASLLGQISGLAQPPRRSSSPDSRSSPIRDPLLPGPSMGKSKGGAPSSDLLPAKQGSGGSSGSDKATKKNADKSAADPAASQESDSFYKMYNKEIKVNQDEIPIILAELTDAAFNFIQRENYEKALILLQKTEGVLEVVSLDGCSRDKYISFITYNNMAMCFQKLGMLEECIIYLKGGIQQISEEKFYKSKKISMRSRRVAQECKLKLQLCAILSQNQNHYEALENARRSVKLAHQMFKDMDELCQIFIDKINYRDNLIAAQEQSDLEENERAQLISMVLDSSPVKEIPKNFLEQSISLVERSSLKMGPVVKEVRKRLVGAVAAPEKSDKASTQSIGKKVDKVFENFEHDANGKISILQAKHRIQQLIFEQLGLETGDGSETRMSDIINEMHSNLDGFISRDELVKQLKQLKDNNSEEKKAKAAGEEGSSTDNKNEDDEELEEEKPDMRSVLGFLNQNEWIYNLNIGNIMQIQPISMKEFLQENQDEVELSRDSFLSKLSILTVSYFCMSTEMRFLLQSRGNITKPEVKKERELESEFWHAKALEIACTFLPSECPLLNHVLLSYQKHHDPTLQPIREDEEQEDLLSVLRPLKGIEQSKYQPIIRKLPCKVNLSPGKQPPLKKFLRQNEEELLEEIVSFNPDKVKKVVSIDDKHIQVSFQMELSPKEMIGRGQVDISAIEQVKEEECKASRESLKNKLIDDRGTSESIQNNVVRYPDQFEKEKLPFSLVESKNQTGEPPSRGSKISETDTQLLAKELYNSQREESMDLERQILDGVESPQKSNEILQDKNLNRSKEGFPFDSQDSIAGIDSMLEESESKMYDIIIGKLLNNPRIDKRALLQRFVAKLEMESNTSGQLVNDINQIRSISDNLGRPSVSKSNNLASSAQIEEPGDVLKQSNLSYEEERRLSEQQITRLQKEPSFDEDEDDSVANEMSVEHRGIQEARQSANMNKKVFKQHTTSQQVLKPQSAKLTSQPQKPKYETGARTRSSSHNMKSSKHNKRQKLKSNNVLGDQSKYKKVKSYLEGDSLFKDIEKSTEYQDNLIVNVMEQSVNTDHSAAIDVDEINLEARSSQKSQSKSRERIAQTELNQDSVHSVDVRILGDTREKSEQKSNSFSRPSTAITNVTRHSSSNLRRRKRNNLLNQQPQKCLVATKLQEDQRPRSESSSRGRYQKYQQRYSNQARPQTVLQVDKEATASTANFPAQQQRQTLEKKRKSFEGRTNDTEQRTSTKIISKKFQSQQQSGKTQGSQSIGQHLKTSKLTKLVSHKQIDTNYRPKKSKKILSQTKNVVSHNKSSSVQAALVTRGRQRVRKKSRSKSKSSRSKTRSASSKRKSKSNKGSGSENYRNMQNELAQYSFDIVTDERNKNMTSAANFSKKLQQQPSINDLQRQVLENQRTLLDILSKQQLRNNSDSKNQPQDNKRKKSSIGNLRTTLDLQSKNKDGQVVQRMSNPGNKMQSQAQILLQAQSLTAVPVLQLEKKYSTGGTGVPTEKENLNIINHANLMKINALQNSASQTAGLTGFISQISGQRSNSKEMNKSLQYLKRQQKHQTKGQSQPSRTKMNNRMAANSSQAGLDQAEFKKNLVKEVNYLKNRLSNHFQNVHQQKKQSPPKARSGSNKRSGERKNSNSRSRSPTQPNKALIPRKKSFAKRLNNMNSTGEGNVSNDILNMSVGDKVLKRNKASTHLAAKRKVNTLLKDNIPEETNLIVYNSLDENDRSAGPEILNQAHQANMGLATGGQNSGVNHHSLSMFDGEASAEANYQFMPLQHQLSHNAIIMPHNLSQNYSLPTNGNKQQKLPQKQSYKSNAGHNNSVGGERRTNSKNPIQQSRLGKTSKVLS